MTVEAAGQATRNRLSWAQLYFTITGRATRFDYWVRFVLPYFVGIFIASFIDALTGTFDRDVGFGLLGMIFILLMIWPSLAVGIKRCHDRDRSGWFMLLSLIPLVNIWLLIELGFVPGMAGTNRFGPDPLGKSQLET
jgi:uncharacterized membrane protein YhaH (DUF805 family)